VKHDPEVRRFEAGRIVVIANPIYEDSSGTVIIRLAYVVPRDGGQTVPLTSLPASRATLRDEPAKLTFASNIPLHNWDDMDLALCNTS
jgi:hypothetical protein